MTPMLKLVLSFLITGSAFFSKGQEVVRDRDGNVYQTVKAGRQVWMADNLRVTHYRNGDAIPGIKDQKEWDSQTGGAFSTAWNDPEMIKSLGRIYNWYAVADPGNICPDGWHVPSETEWIELLTFLAGENLSPVKTSAVIPASNKNLNESLFKVLPVDYFRGFDLECSHAGYGGGGWWTSTSTSDQTAYFHGINYDTASKIRLEGRKNFGYSIRCIKSEL